MTNKDKLETLQKLQRRLRKLLKQDLGDQTEYADRALDQITYAVEELESDELDFRLSVARK
jgi:hypothetical protein